MPQTLPAVFKHGDQFRVDYTPGADVACGDIVNMGNGLMGYCTSPGGIEAGVKGSLDIGGKGGVYSIMKNGTAGPVFAVGDTVGFDVTLELAVRAEDASADHALGICVKAAGANEDTVWVHPMVGMNALLQPVAAEALVPLTDNSGGTASNTIADVPAAYTEATLANQVASLAAKVNAIIAVLQQ